MMYLYLMFHSLMFFPDKKALNFPLVYAVIISLMIASCKAQNSFSPNFPDTPDLEEMRNTFIDIPDNIQTSIYWYWISDNLSKEGVVEDLKAMKAVGINRAFIGNIGLDD